MNADHADLLEMDLLKCACSAAFFRKAFPSEIFARTFGLNYFPPFHSPEVFHGRASCGPSPVSHTVAHRED